MLASTMPPRAAAPRSRAPARPRPPPRWPRTERGRSRRTSRRPSPGAAATSPERASTVSAWREASESRSRAPKRGRAPSADGRRGARPARSMPSTRCSIAAWNVRVDAIGSTKRRRASRRHATEYCRSRDLSKTTTHLPLWPSPPISYSPKCSPSAAATQPPTRRSERYAALVGTGRTSVCARASSPRRATSTSTTSSRPSCAASSATTC